VSEILQRSRDSIVTPVAILASHPHDQFRKVAGNRRSSRLGAVFGAIKLVGDQLKIPTQVVCGFATAIRYSFSIASLRFYSWLIIPVVGARVRAYAFCGETGSSQFVERV
jgi:hypothetical protein